MPDETSQKAKPVFTAAEREKAGLVEFDHPLNPGRSLMRGVSLSDHAGMRKTGIHIGVLGPGKESFVYHSHLREEEWMFVLSGRGRIEIDGEFHELGPGDFVGFAAPSPAHQVSNPHDSDLTYLTGGERSDLEIADFPRLDKVMMRNGMNATLYPRSAGTSLNPAVEGKPVDPGEDPKKK